MAKVYICQEAYYHSFTGAFGRLDQISLDKKAAFLCRALPLAEISDPV